MLTPEWLDRAAMERHSLDMRQFADFRQAEYAGQRLVEAYNASGLSFSLLPDRGLDIWDARYRGVPLTWLAPGSPTLADAGHRWLRQFPGGLLTTCGLTHAGVPETDAQTGEARDLHGEYTRLPARDVAARGAWEGSDYVMELTGTVYQSILFGEQLRLVRSVRMPLARPTFTITDTITNLGDLVTPLMTLYHINLGYPLIQAGVRLDTAHASVVSRDEAARPGYPRWPEYDAAISQYAEQVYFHHPKTDADGWTRVVLASQAFGFEVAWDAAALPYFTQWKNVRQGIYVSGLEPGNCLPEGRDHARAAGRLHTLAPGETRRFTVTMTVLDGADSVAAAREAGSRLQASGQPVVGCDLSGFRP